MTKQSLKHISFFLAALMLAALYATGCGSCKPKDPVEPDTDNCTIPCTDERISEAVSDIKNCIEGQRQTDGSISTEYLTACCTGEDDFMNTDEERMSAKCCVEACSS